MGEAGIDRFHIAHVLNHRSVTHSTVTAIYDRYRYDKEKRAALEKWAEYCSGSWTSNRADDGAGAADPAPECLRIQDSGHSTCAGERALTRARCALTHSA
jgi:hypothetical protein